MLQTHIPAKAERTCGIPGIFRHGARYVYRPFRLHSPLNLPRAWTTARYTDTLNTIPGGAMMRAPVILLIVFLITAGWAAAPMADRGNPGCLDMTWSGTGFQLDTKEIGTVRLTVNHAMNSFAISYPSLK